MKNAKRLLGVILISVLMLSLSVSAYAQEIDNPTPEDNPVVETEQPENDPPEESQEDEVPPEEDPPSAVYTLEELYTAIAAADDGDTIFLGGSITVSSDAIIGAKDKILTIKPSDDFSGNTFFSLSTNNNQNISFQNLVLNGEHSTGAHITAIANSTVLSNSETQGHWSFENVTIKNFNSSTAVVTVTDANAEFSFCNIANNTSRRCGGIEVNSGAYAEVSNCTLSDNRSETFGAAIRCMGTSKILNSIIRGNFTINTGVVLNGGGVYIDNNASCEIVSCHITNNSADMGGGISCLGSVCITDTLIYGNTGLLGGNDIRCFGGSNVTVTYTENMQAIYTEDNPVGFYADNFENIFNADTNAIFVGETIALENNPNGNYGVRFVFEGDLPQTDQTPEDTPIPLTVFSLEELHTAIGNAEDGDTILFGAMIGIYSDTVIGDAEKTLVFKLSEEYNPNGFFFCNTEDCKSLTLRNIIFDGTQTANKMISAIDSNNSTIEEKSQWAFESIVFKNFTCSWAAVIVRNANAVFTSCVFTDNFGGTCGAIRIESGAYAEFTDCLISNNSTGFCGGAIQCWGETHIENCTITDNTAINSESHQGEGGGISIKNNGAVEVVASRITGNSADIGGGISCEGKVSLIDAPLYGNAATNGGDDVYCYSAFSVDVGYTNSMNTVYLEDTPVGFFSDDIGSRFDPTANAHFIGESFSATNSQVGLLGAKFVFSADLPEESEKPEDEDTDTPPDDDPDNSADDPSDSGNTPPPVVVDPPYIDDDTQSGDDATDEDNRPNIDDDIPASDDADNTDNDTDSTDDDTVDTEPIPAPVPPAPPVIEDVTPLPDTSDIEPPDAQDAPIIADDTEDKETPYQEPKTEEVTAPEVSPQQEKENNPPVATPSAPPVETVEDQKIETESPSADNDTEEDTPVVVITMGTLASLAAGILGIFKFKRKH